MNSAPLPSRIVIAEDNPADVGLVREALREHNIPCDLRVISDGREMLEFIERLDSDATLPCPDLFMLDLSLPKHGGLEILSRVRASGRCASTPVIVLSSSDWVEDRQIAENSRATHYFRKPSSLREFLQLGGVVKDVIAATPPG